MTRQSVFSQSRPDRRRDDKVINHLLTPSPPHLLIFMHPALFLDRDGVIIENRARYVRRWEDVEFFPQALAALAQIRHTPYKVIVVTNQSAVGRGLITMETAVALNDRIMDVVRQHNGRVDASYICPDTPGQETGCRKPLPGMLQQAAQEHQIDLSQSIMIGDALTDVQAGRAAGVRISALLHTGRGQAQAAKPEAQALAPFPIYADLQTAVTELILHPYLLP
ncbi:MAG: HAD family hydrolase [Chloroflexi bacterium]|nr:HAD family hydrolase [Chloroflexota bacterium]